MGNKICEDERKVLFGVDAEWYPLDRLHAHL